MFIAVCGLDGSGKSTQVQLLADQVKNAYVTREPTDWYRHDPAVKALLSESVGDLRVMEELALFAAADRLRHVRTEVAPNLGAGRLVISDRYILSTFAHFLARGIDDIDWLRALNRSAPLPDLTLYIDVPVDVCIQRIQARDGMRRQAEEQDRARLQRVADAYLTQPWGTAFLPRYVVVDGNRPPSQVLADVLAAVDGARAQV